ncbi:MAG: hypothetical protein BMS9Abin02_0241 [Anaerolineae bacterium]|nr:MAG: hypothetical protein BMS9Abin02_0241 [Anaerolineae bacterium]
MPLLPGEIVNNRYKIVYLLGEGPYRATYRAWDQEDHIDVAINEYLAPSTDRLRLFRKEFSRLTKLKHSQLPKVIDYFFLEEIGHYYLFEFIDGIDCASLLGQYQPLPSDLITGWLQLACEPLTYLHGKDQLHHQIKPANIRVTPSGEVFLVNIGLANLGFSQEIDGYAAPEIQKTITTSASSDIYSLGATLYKLLTGVTPPNALERESGLEDLVPAREINPNIEPYLSVVATRAMDLLPEARYESAAEFSQALNRPTGRPSPLYNELRRTDSTVFPVVNPRRPDKPRRIMEQRTILALGAILLIFAGVVVGLVLANQSPKIQEASTAATATIRSEVIAVLTAITTLTPTPAPSTTPIPTPVPVVDDKTGARMIYIPGGIFRMGDDEGENDERPSHIVRLDPYFIDELEVSNEQYSICVNEGACDPPDRPGATLHRAYYGDPGFADYPVIFVSWNDAQNYCAWRGARLPSEAEWERAAGYDPEQAIKYRFPWGDTFDGTYLNFCDANCPLEDRNITYDDGYGDTAPVGTYKEGASQFGLYDMAGNVMEWVSDWYDPRYYETSTDTNPLGPLEGGFKSLRGGSWLSLDEEVRVSGRSSYSPSVSRANLGFRCSSTAP